MRTQSESFLFHCIIHITSWESVLVNKIQCLKYLLVKYLIGIGPFFIVPFGYLKIVLFLKNHDEKNLSSKEEQ